MLVQEMAAPQTALPAADRGSRLRQNLRVIRILWYREVLRLRRNWVRGVVGLVTPLMFLLIFGLGLESAGGGPGGRLADYAAYLLPGMLVMAMQAPAIAVGLSIVWDRQIGFLRQTLVAPVRRSSILIGLCLGGATTGTLYGLPLLAVGGFVGVPYDARLLLVLVEAALVALTFTAFGVLAAVCITRIETFQIVISTAMMPLLFFSGAFFPVNGLPGWLGTVCMLNPLTYAIDAIRRTMPGDLRAGASTGPELWGWTPPVVLELILVGWLALTVVAVAGRRFSRPA